MVKMVETVKTVEDDLFSNNMVSSYKFYGYFENSTCLPAGEITILMKNNKIKSNRVVYDFLKKYNLISKTDCPKDKTCIKKQPATSCYKKNHNGKIAWDLYKNLVEKFEFLKWNSDDLQPLDDFMREQIETFNKYGGTLKPIFVRFKPKSLLVEHHMFKSLFVVP